MFKIVTIAAGHVVVGKEVSRDATVLRMTDCSIIRRWGTTEGLGELCLKGRTPNTITDPMGDVEIPMNSVIMISLAPAWRQSP